MKGSFNGGTGLDANVKVEDGGLLLSDPPAEDDGTDGLADSEEEIRRIGFMTGSSTGLEILLNASKICFATAAEGLLCA